MPEPGGVVVGLHDWIAGPPAPQVAAAPPSVLPGAQPPPNGETPANGSPPAPAPVAPPPPGVCNDTVVYILTYGSALRDKARSWRAPWRALGASVPPIEDLLSTSRRAGRSPPTGHPEPSVIIRDETARACAQALVQTVASPTGQPWVIKMLPRSNRAAPGAIEVWLPRGKDA